MVTEKPKPEAQRLVRLRRFAYWMDEGIRIPGTRMRIGLDPILGLFPGIGDAAGAIMSGSIILEAVRQGISRYGLLRMAANVALDTIVGSVPLLGDIFDAGWKGNRRNMEILERHAAGPSPSSKADRMFVLLSGGALILVAFATAAIAMIVAGRVLRWLLSGS